MSSCRSFGAGLGMMYLQVIQLDKSLKCCVTDVDNGIEWEVSAKQTFVK